MNSDDTNSDETSSEETSLDETSLDETIVAISSAVGAAARMIVRLSGPDALRIVASLAQGHPLLQPATSSCVHLRIESLQFPAALYCFHSPRSATGEDVVEIHLPGNPLLARMTLDAAIRAGARSAEPGEFTARAYFNGRLDLSSAEGVAGVIAAQNGKELEAARRLLSGELSRRLGPVIESLAQTLALIEAEIDFAGEEITLLSRSQLATRIGAIDSDLQKLSSESARFETLSHEPKVVLIGRPNAGKSTLLNALAGTQRAIVSPTAGTTRDALSAPVKLRRGFVTILDVAGIVDADSGDEISRMMRNASQNAIATADVIVLVRAVDDDLPDITLTIAPHLRMVSKADLQPRHSNDLAVSAHSGTGLTELRDRLDRLAFGPNSAGSSLALNARHIQALHDARAALARCEGMTEAELIALELREALDALGGIAGSVTPDDVLGRVFSSFCIGK